jgi:hypothetical protein
VLVGLDVDEEDQGVVVFDLLHRRFGCQRVLDDVVGIHPVKKSAELMIYISLKLILSRKY